MATLEHGLPSLNKLSTLVCFGSGLAAGLALSKVMEKIQSTGSKDNHLSPEKWIRVGTVSDLIIHPVKSLPGTSVKRATVTKLGLQDCDIPTLRDRTFLITNDKGVFQTQRVLSAMVFIYPTVKESVIHLRFVGNQEQESDDILIDIPKEDASNKKLVRIWGDKVYALDCGDKAGQWLDKVTGQKGLRLVYHFGDVSQRAVDKTVAKKFPAFSPADLGTFQDETAFMMMTEESLDELNSKVEKKFTFRSFRPCIVLNGVSEPFAEDAWSFVRIGSDHENSPIFKSSRPCQRCKITTLDPETGEVRPDGEPLKTLTALTERLVGNAHVTKSVKNSAVMGNHFGIFKNANTMIKIGDPIYAAVL